MKTTDKSNNETVIDCPAVSCSPPLTASEAVYGLLGWLTSREEVTTLSSQHDATPAADIAKKFMEENRLNEPREGWHSNLIHPSGECSHSVENDTALCSDTRNNTNK